LLELLLTYAIPLMEEDEAKYPEPTVVHVRRTFEHFSRKTVDSGELVVLSDLEMLFAYSALIM